MNKWFLLIFMGLPVVALADPSLQELRAMHEDAMRQLAAAQDRKNELANENEKLRMQIADLEARVERLSVAQDTNAGQFREMISRVGSFLRFVELNQDVLSRWQAFEADRRAVDASARRGMQPFEPIDRQWPFSSI